MVKKLLSQGSSLFSRRQTNILSAAMVLMMAVFVSRILGLVRDRLLAWMFFGNGEPWQLDVYFAAFRLPDMIFQLVVLGALSAAFIPVFSDYLERDKSQSWKIANTMISLAVAVFFLASLLIAIFAYPLSNLIAPEFDSLQIELMVNLTRLMLVAQFFFVISNFLTGILQSYQLFLIPAIAPILYNLGIIIGIIFLGPVIGIYGPAVGVVIGAVLHWIVQYPLTKKLGFTFSFSWDVKHPGIQEILKLMVPRTLSLAVDQIELNIAVFLATTLQTGSLSIFYFAQHLFALPVGLFGMTIGQAALPLLSKEAASSKNGLQQFKELLISSLNYIWYLALPASVLLLVLRIPLVRIALGTKNFPWEATLLTGKVLAMFSFSIAAQAAIQLLVRAFYALQDTKTPLIISAISVAISVLFSWFFIWEGTWDASGLALAMSLAGLAQTMMLITALYKKVGGFAVSSVIIPFGKMLVASALTGVFLWIPMRLLDEFVLDTTRTIDLILLTIAACGMGFSVYIVFSKIFQIQELDRLLATLKRFGSWRKILEKSQEPIAEAAVMPQAAEVRE